MSDENEEDFGLIERLAEEIDQLPEVRARNMDHSDEIAHAMLDGEGEEAIRKMFREETKRRADNLAATLRAEGYEKEAAMVEAVSPEDERNFDRWLSVPENREKWDRALARARHPGMEFTEAADQYLRGVFP